MALVRRASSGMPRQDALACSYRWGALGEIDGAIHFGSIQYVAPLAAKCFFRAIKFPSHDAVCSTSALRRTLGGIAQIGQQLFQIVQIAARETQAVGHRGTGIALRGDYPLARIDQCSRNGLRAQRTGDH